MAATVFPVPGKLYLTPTAVTGVTGTLIAGIEENDISVAMDADIREFRTGVGVNAGFDEVMGRDGTFILLIQLRNQSTAGLKLQFPHLTTDGAIMRPTGGTAAGVFGSMPKFSLVVRPVLTTEKYVYAPSWSAAQGSVWLAAHSEVRAQLDGDILALKACKLSTSYAGSPPAMWASSAAIAAAYNVTE